MTVTPAASRRGISLTPMSSSGRVGEGLKAARGLKSHGHSSVARCVHGVRAVLFAVPFAALAGACVVPPPLEVKGEADAGANAPPIIIEAHDSAATAFEPPGTVTVDRDALNPTIGVTVYDVDSSDTLFVGMFVDFDRASPLGPRSECEAPPAADRALQRSTACSTAALCTSDDVRPEPHTLEIVVYDREPRGAPNFRDAEEPGLTSIWTFDMICTETNPT